MLSLFGNDEITWYKKARLLDKDPSPDGQTFRACMYCKRWGVDRGGGEEWKKNEELDAQEAQDAAKAIHEMQHGGIQSKVGVSHGVCSYCDELLGVGIPENNEEINSLVEKSLSM